MTLTWLARQTATVVATGALALGGFAATASASTAARTAPAAATAASTASAPAAGIRLPRDFPRPPHSVLIKEVRSGRTSAFELRVRSERSAYRFWLRELPRHGWTIVRAISRGRVAAIRFRGHGDGGPATEILINKRKAAVFLTKNR